MDLCSGAEGGNPGLEASHPGGQGFDASHGSAGTCRTHIVSQAQTELKHFEMEQSGVDNVKTDEHSDAGQHVHMPSMHQSDRSGSALHEWHLRSG